MPKRRLLILLLAFVLTRGVGVFLAANPQLYGTSYSRVTWDPLLYGSWAFDIVDGHRTPYSGINIEYPPGVLPFAVLPEIDRSSSDSYLIRFEFLMLLVDIAAFAGLLRLARRWGSNLGPWMWVGGIFLLGPIAYTRLDLIPALATIWAIERAAAGSWFSTGGWLAYGALSKVYPMFLMPIAFITSNKKKALVSGIALVSFFLLLPHIGAIRQVYDSVFGFHSSRGVHVESTWGGSLMAATRVGYEAKVELSFGSFNVASGLSPLFKKLGSLASLIALAYGIYKARKVKDDIPAMAALMYGTLAVIMAVGTVFSPQFVIWLIALGAIALCRESELLKGPILTLLPVALVTQVIYPFIYELLLSGNTSSIAVLLSRNLLVLVSGLGVWNAITVQHELLHTPPSLNEAMAVPSLALAGGDA